jgi:putative ABC transport system permease protein
LQPNVVGTVVLNQTAAARLGGPPLASDVTVWIEGKLREWTVVGIIDEVGGAATLYVATGELDDVVGQSGMTTGVRMVAPTGTSSTIARTEEALSSDGFRVVSVVPTTELESAIDQHVLVFIALLIALAILMAVIGLLGLASATSINVLERTREHGIMKAIGARGSVIQRLVVSEAVITGIAGLALALIVSIPVTAVVGNVLGRLTFDLPLPLVISSGAIVIWSVMAVSGAVLAALSAAMRAAKLTVHESLSAQLGVRNTLRSKSPRERGNK